MRFTICARVTNDMDEEKTSEEQIIHDARNTAASLQLENEVKAANLVAVAKVTADQVKKVLDAHKDETLNMLTIALRDVVSEGNDTDKLILIQRIPFICNDIRMIKSFGMYILLGIGSLFILLVGNLLLAHSGITPLGN